MGSTLSSESILGLLGSRLKGGGILALEVGWLWVRVEWLSICRILICRWR